MNYISEQEKVRRINESHEVVKIIRQRMKELKQYYFILMNQQESLEEILKEKYPKYHEIMRSLVGLNKNSILYYEMHRDQDIKAEIECKFWKAHDEVPDEKSTKIWDGTNGNLISDYEEAFTTAEVLRNTAENYMNIYESMEEEYKFIQKEIKKIEKNYENFEKQIEKVQKDRVMYQNLPIAYFEDSNSPYYEVPEKKQLLIFKVLGINNSKEEYIPEEKYTFIDRNGNAHISGSKDIIDYEVEEYKNYHGDVTFGEMAEITSKFEEEPNSQIINERIIDSNNKPIIYVGSRKR